MTDLDDLLGDVDLFAGITSSKADPLSDLLDDTALPTGVPDDLMADIVVPVRKTSTSLRLPVREQRIEDEEPTTPIRRIWPCENNCKTKGVCTCTHVVRTK